MDLKALIAKMDKIESKKFLTEAETKSDNKQSAPPANKKVLKVEETGYSAPTTSNAKKSKVSGDTNKRMTSPSSLKRDDDADAMESIRSTKTQRKVKESLSISQQLLREFGLDEADATNPWANDPAKSAAWAALSPEDQAWLGGADPTDTNILARAPNKGQPAPMTPAQGDQMAADIAKANAPAPAPMTPAQGDQMAADIAKANAPAPMTPAQGDQMAADIAKANAPAAQTSAQPKPAAQTSAQQKIDPAKVQRFKELLAKFGTA